MSPSWTRDKRILLGVSGGIAAYKAVELVRAFVKADCQVEVILTDMAARLVSPLTLSTLSKRRIWRDADLRSDEEGWKIPHITLSGWADLMVVAPCTANVLRIAATGDTSTLLGATLLACSAPKLFFPAMNERMWDNPATKANAHTLEAFGYRVIDPDSGPLACGYEGKGRLPAIEAILDETWSALCPTKDFARRHVLVTAGPTHEYLDPVRFLSNPSSGKMGYALAAEARYRGAEVTLVSGPSNERPPSGVRLVRVTSALEMRDAVLAELPGSDVVIKAAAVGDYRARETVSQKMKRENADSLTIELVQNPDIASEVGARKRTDQVLVGFAAETENVRENALRKIERKGLDLVVANDVSCEDAGFAADGNRVEIYFAKRHGREPLSGISGSKQEVASKILDAVAGLMPKE